MVKLAIVAWLCCVAFSSSCPYEKLPKDVHTVVVADTSLCPKRKTVCVVNRNCTLNKTKHWDAVGNFLDLNSTQYDFIGDSMPINLDMLVLPDILNDLSIEDFKLTLPLPFLWPNNLTDLSLMYNQLTVIPQLPQTISALLLGGNELNSSEELLSLPPSITWLSLDLNLYTELINLNFNNISYLYLCENGRLSRIENVTFSDQILFIDLSDLAISNWIMNNATFQSLNRLRPNTTGYVAETDPGRYSVGYKYHNLTITSNEEECTKKNGQLQEIWEDKRSRNPLYNAEIFIVCVLKDPLIEQPIVLTEGVSLSAVAIAGIAVGSISILILVGFFIYRSALKSNRESSWISSTEVNSVDMSCLSSCRIDLNDIKMTTIIGAGAFADVYLGLLQGENVAIKKLHGDKLSGGQIQAFVDEVHLMSTFDSPYIVKLLGAAWVSPSNLRGIMEYMDGGDLREYFQSHTPEEFPWDDKYLHIHSIVEGLVYLHSFNIIHRDFKSRNILLDSTKGTKLSDFGVAKEDLQLTMTKGVGTFRWMAPEVIQDQAYTVAADIYSLGCVLTEFDTHVIPYNDIVNLETGKIMADAILMVKLIVGEIKPTISESCPSWIRSLALQCLSFDPNERPTATEVAHTIQSNLKALSLGIFSL